MGMKGMWGGGMDPWGEAGMFDAPGASGPKTPPVSWLVLTQDSQIINDGLPAEAPAIAHDKEFQDSFSQSGDFLYAVVGEEYDNVVYTHDTDWDVFPEVGEAMKAASMDENCFCVAVSASHGKWGVGLGQ